MNGKDCFSVQTVALSILTAALAEGAVQDVPVRQLLVQAAVCTLALCALSALAGAAWCGSRSGRRAGSVAKAGVMLLLAVEWADIFWQAQQVCRQEFSSMALVGLLPLLLWAGSRVPPSGWDASARVLWWFVAAAALLLVVGLSGQMHWERLWETEQLSLPVRWQVPLYGEYLALPLLCGKQRWHHAVWLPFWSFAAQTVPALCMALVFGTGYPQRELLRALSLGMFSRMDSLLLLVWLACALFRLEMLWAALGMLAGRYQAPEECEVQP